MLENDSKNYHAWSYRQYLIERHGLWEYEIVDVHRLILNDVRNNSAWNQRFFVISKGPEPITDEIITREIVYAIGMIHMAPHNESPWAYLRG
jgi:protein farnesyltransferase/geranylgeranyltransferase type-1 subunit alpha